LGDKVVGGTVDGTGGLVSALITSGGSPCSPASSPINLSALIGDEKNFIRHFDQV